MIVEEIKELWRHYYNNGYEDVMYGLEEPGPAMIYGYDAIHTLLTAFASVESDLDITNTSALISALNDTIINDIDFIGATGRVTFDENGDRIDGLYSFGNLLGGADASYFGYFYQGVDGKIVTKIDVNKIVFPEEFTDKGIIPQSGSITYDQTVNIDKSVSMTMFVFLSLSLFITIILAIFWVYHRNNLIIKAASWRLNIIMCIGAIFAYASAILYGIDELYTTNITSLSVRCNVRLWWFTISFTLLFMPLFMKTYRISLLFTAMLTKRVLEDKKLFLAIMCCLFIDLIILMTVTLSIRPLQRMYVDGDLEEIDEIRFTQYKYGTCSLGENIFESFVFYGCLIFWKVCQLGFGLHVTTNVSRIKDITRTNMLQRFDETGIQIVSIIFTFIIICMSIPIFVFGPTEEPNFFYLLISIGIVLVGNVVLMLNLLPRTIAVIQSNEEVYGLSQVQRIEAKIKRKLTDYDTVQSNIELHSTPTSDQTVTM